MTIFHEVHNQSFNFERFDWILDTLEIYDNRRGPSNEKSPLQADTDSQYVLHIQQSFAGLKTLWVCHFLVL